MQDTRPANQREAGVFFGTLRSEVQYGMES
jgi:hypothetical protein